MWQLDTLFPGAGWDASATPWSTPLASQSGANGDHFARIWPTIKPLYDKTGSAAHRQTLIAAANAKNAQFNATINAFKTPEITSNSGNLNATFGILMDQTLDLELMFWASDATGNPSYRENAIKHLQTVIARMIRADGSVFQRFFFNGTTGAPIGGENWQGASNSSTWSRGQAWAVYGISRIAELTNRIDFIAAARKVSDYFINHLPSDYVPYWDFQAPGIPNTYRDSSAAAIAARGLLRLGKLTGDAAYTTAAANILASLSSAKYLTEGTTSRGVLRHAALHVPANRAVDASIVFADHYFLEAAIAYMNRG
jgi:unsaturated chondroitin disaccharide hydrolase